MSEDISVIKFQKHTAPHPCAAFEPSRRKQRPTFGTVWDVEGELRQSQRVEMRVRGIQQQLRESEMENTRLRQRLKELTRENMYLKSKLIGNKT